SLFSRPPRRLSRWRSWKETSTRPTARSRPSCPATARQHSPRSPVGLVIRERGLFWRTLRAGIGVAGRIVGIGHRRVGRRRTRRIGGVAHWGNRSLARGIGNIGLRLHGWARHGILL